MIDHLKDILTDEDVLNAPKVLRTHCYAQHPYVYEIDCLLCGGRHITWSEFEGHIWCYDCEKDVNLIHRYAGIFGGPIPTELAKMFGVTFDRINLKTQEIIEDEKAGDEEYKKTWVRTEELENYDIVLNKKIDDKWEEIKNGN